MRLKQLCDFCDNYLRVDEFDDYCPNGLQVESSAEVNHIVSGVTASLDLALGLFRHFVRYIALRRASIMLPDNKKRPDNFLSSRY